MERKHEIATIIDDMADERRHPAVARIANKLAHVGILSVKTDVVGGGNVELELGGARYVGEEEIMSAIDTYNMHMEE
jgi:hypothetical protein